MLHSGVASFLLLLAACLAAGASGERSVALEHSLDGQTFTQAGEVLLPADDKAAAVGIATLQTRAQLSEAQQQAVRHLVQDGGLYRIRVPVSTSGGGGPDGEYVTASIPARCWAAAGFSTTLALHLLSAGRVAGVAFQLPCSSASAVPALGTDTPVALPQTSPVHVVLPRTVPAVHMPQPTQQQQQQAAAAKEAAARQTASAQQDGEDGEGESGERKGKQAPPKDERTWLQKNWMVLIGAGLLMANRINAPQEPQRGGGRPAGGGAPARR
eukprot:scaffold15.g4325.t1